MNKAESQGVARIQRIKDRLARIESKVEQYKDAENTDKVKQFSKEKERRECELAYLASKFDYLKE